MFVALVNWVPEQTWTERRHGRVPADGDAPDPLLVSWFHLFLFFPMFL